MADPLESSTNEYVPKSIRAQAQAIEQDCERAAIRASLVSARWDRRNLRLGLSSAIAAAVAAFVVGNDHFSIPENMLPAILRDNAKFAASFFAAVSAILTSALTFLAPSKMAESFHESSNKYRGLRERLRLFVNGAATDEKALADFVKQKQDIDVSHPIVPEWAYRKAHRRLVKKKIRNSYLTWLEKELKKPDCVPLPYWLKQLCVYIRALRREPSGLCADKPAPDKSISAPK
jgi:hypothetical protein